MNLQTLLTTVITDLFQLGGFLLVGHGLLSSSTEVTILGFVTSIASSVISHFVTTTTTSTNNSTATTTVSK